MLGHAGALDVDVPGEVADRALAIAKAVDEAAPGRIRKDVEQPIHARFRRHGASAHRKRRRGINVPLEEHIYKRTYSFGRLVTNGIPWTSFGCEDVEAEYDRLNERGVEFAQKPMTAEDVRMAVFDDACGNLLQIHQ